MKRIPDLPHYTTVPKIAEHLGISRTRVYMLLLEENPKLKSYRIGEYRYILEEDFLKFLEERECGE